MEKSYSVEIMEAGDECPNCHCGTLEETDEEFVCQGECGEVWTKTKEASISPTTQPEQRRTLKDGVRT